MSFDGASDDMLNDRVDKCEELKTDLQNTTMGLDYNDGSLDEDVFKKAIEQIESEISTLDCDEASEEQAKRVREKEKSDYISEVKRQRDIFNARTAPTTNKWNSCFERGCPFPEECARNKFLFDIGVSGSDPDTDVAMNLCDEGEREASELRNSEDVDLIRKYAYNFAKKFLDERTALQSASSSSEQSSDELYGGGSVQELIGMKQAIRNMETKRGAKDVGMRRFWNSLATLPRS